MCAYVCVEVNNGKKSNSMEKIEKQSHSKMDEFITKESQR